jgi:hypothetical protein
MKTMMELLIRLQQLRRCRKRIASNEQLTKGEKNSAVLFKRLVRECLPAEVLSRYDRLKRTEPELLECPEIFAMAVLVSTYRQSSPDQRGMLLAQFPNPSPAASATRRNGVLKSRSIRLPRPRHRALNALRQS